MKYSAWLAILIFAVTLSARAQSDPDDQYIIIYSMMQQADSLKAAGQPAQALTEFQQSLADLKKFQSVYPDWNPTIVNYRIKYITDKINGLTAQMPAPATNAPAMTNANAVTGTTTMTTASESDLQAQVDSLKLQVQQLQTANQLLQDKLKEALSAQPAPTDAQQLAQAQDQVRSLMKENDLLRAGMAGKTNNPNAQAELLTVQQELADANQNLAQQKDRADSLATANKSLDAQLQSLLVGPDSMKALREENAMLKKQLAEMQSGAPASSESAELTQARAQIAELQSDADINLLEKQALEERLQRYEAAAQSAPANTMSAINSEEISKLRARLAVDEAQMVPYTSDELALFSSKSPAPETNVVANAVADNTTATAPAPSTDNTAGTPSDVSLLVAEAQNYFDSHDYVNAEKDYRKILAEDKNNSGAMANLAAIELQENKLGDAESLLKAALAINPGDAYTLSTYGYLEFREQKFDDALDALSRAAKLDPQNAQVENYLGVTLSHKGLRTQAETALRKAIELDPDYGAAHNNLAVIYLTENPPLVELARWHYQKALDEGEPHNPDLEKILAQKGAPVSQ
ncbi:MAG TPA: tetratricopeptide repeat protein [Verrucomicrobiae bacterium]